MYSQVKSSGDSWTLQKFSTKWPGSLVTSVALDAKKNYMSTNIKGNFTFVLNPTKQDLKPDTAEPAQELVPPGSEGPEFARSSVKASNAKPDKVGTNKV